MDSIPALHQGTLEGRERRGGKVKMGVRGERKEKR